MPPNNPEINEQENLLQENGKDENQQLLDEIEANQKNEMVDTTTPQKVNGGYTENKEFHTSEHGNTFEYEDSLARAKDDKEAVDAELQNIKDAKKIAEETNQKLKNIEDKKEEIEEVSPGEETSTTVEDQNPIPDVNSGEYNQFEEIKINYTEQLIAFNQQEKAIDDETVEKLNTLAA